MDAADLPATLPVEETLLLWSGDTHVISVATDLRNPLHIECIKVMIPTSIVAPKHMIRAITVLVLVRLLTCAGEGPAETRAQLIGSARQAELREKRATLNALVRDFPFDTIKPDKSLKVMPTTVSGEYRLFVPEGTGWEVSGKASNQTHFLAPKNMRVSMSVISVDDALSLVVRTIQCNFTRAYVVRVDNIDLPGDRRMTREISVVFPARNPQIEETRYYYNMNNDSFELDPEHQVCVTAVFEFPENASLDDIRELLFAHYGKFVSVCTGVSNGSEVKSARQP